uniref:Lens fiber membrane intrinsic protein-like n=1 Tax=Geotrypetes seraphini TaxID=260995 RepID=A0A6P8SIS0_GEOSA|nr:lens fiber membrane intrinsic protein-like [Geotrypetes seraphini]XP_033818864.1 lens fiber membrane intrinsic protein-like [Geotrypetes seraphini]XP_033818865.1 lens fiber membrane intrinsic protein-like [Geotrypetes seraphini]
MSTIDNLNTETEVSTSDDDSSLSQVSTSCFSSLWLFSKIYPFIVLILRWPEWVNCSGTRNPKAIALILSCVSSVFWVVSTATEFWLKVEVMGIPVTRGLWKECQFGYCQRIPVHLVYLVVVQFFMALSILTCYTSVYFGVLSFITCRTCERIQRSFVSAILCFNSAFFGFVALTTYTGQTAGLPESTYMWSYALGWISIFMSLYAGTYHFIAHKKTLHMQKETSESILVNVLQKPSFSRTSDSSYDVQDPGYI